MSTRHHSPTPLVATFATFKAPQAYFFSSTSEADRKGLLWKGRNMAANDRLPLEVSYLFLLLEHHGKICSGCLPGRILLCEKIYMEMNVRQVKESTRRKIKKHKRLKRYKTTSPSLTKLLLLSINVKFSHFSYV